MPRTKNTHDDPRRATPAPTLASRLSELTSACFTGIWVQMLTAVENGGAGRSKMVALGGVDLP
jgi:hypothetical protein